MKCTITISPFFVSQKKEASFNNGDQLSGTNFPRQNHICFHGHRDARSANPSERFSTSKISSLESSALASLGKRFDGSRFSARCCFSLPKNLLLPSHDRRGCEGQGCYCELLSAQSEVIAPSPLPLPRSVVFLFSFALLRHTEKEVCPERESERERETIRVFLPLSASEPPNSGRSASHTVRSWGLSFP